MAQIITKVKLSTLLKIYQQVKHILCRQSLKFHCHALDV